MEKMDCPLEKWVILNYSTLASFLVSQSQALTGVLIRQGFAA
jgi:hypothetical protein